MARLTGRGARNKGSRGEREFRDLLRAHGFQAIRTGRGYGKPKDDVSHDVDGYHFEVKRRERICIPTWLRQAEEDAKERTPVVVYKQNGKPWYAVLPAEALLELLERHEEDPDIRPHAGPCGIS